MNADERAIRDLYDSWQHASAARNVSVLMSLMAEDAVFLTPDRPPVRGRAAFATLLESVTRQYRVEHQWTIEAIEVHGEVAHVWGAFKSALTPTAGGSALNRSGHMLTVLHKRPDGSWVIVRHANVMTRASMEV